MMLRHCFSCENILTSFEVVVFCRDINIETYSLNVLQESGWQCKHGIPGVFTLYWDTGRLD